MSHNSWSNGLVLWALSENNAWIGSAATGPVADWFWLHRDKVESEESDWLIALVGAHSLLAQIESENAPGALDSGLLIVKNNLRLEFETPKLDIRGGFLDRKDDRYYIINFPKTWARAIAYTALIMGALLAAAAKGEQFLKYLGNLVSMFDAGNK